MILYIIHSFVFQFILLIVYVFLLKKETGFTINRIFLLIAPILGFILPVIKIPILKTQFPLQEVVTLSELIIKDTPHTLDTNELFNFNISILLIIWLLGAGYSIYLFLKKTNALLQIKKSAIPTYLNKTRVYTIPKSKDSFTFLNTIFIGSLLAKEEKETIFLHESIHKKQKHSWDLLYFEILRIVFWFNPLLYIFQKEIKFLHEYIADFLVIKHINKKEYYQNILSQVFKTSEISFINSFFNKNSLKHRIIMLQKSNQKPSRLKYLLIAPILGVMLFYSSCTQETKSDTETVAEKIAELKMAMEQGTISENDRIELLNLLKELTPPTPPIPLDPNNVPFSIIEKVPIYPGCEGSNEELKKCFSEKIGNFVNSKFDVSLAKKLNLSGKQRITAMFKIDPNGKIIDVRARAAHPDLANEVKHIIESLPNMKPGQHNGKAVGVLYSLPIIFEIK